MTPLTSAQGGVIHLLETFDRWVARAEQLICLLTVAGVILILVAQVIFRYVLNQPLFWAEEVATYLMVIMTFSGLSILTHKRELVRIQLISLEKRGCAGCSIQVLVEAVLLALSILLAIYAWRHLGKPGVWSERSATLAIPRATIYAAFAISITGLCLHQVINLIKSIQDTKASL